jgi:hypothetical protein
MFINNHRRKISCAFSSKLPRCIICFVLTFHTTTFKLPNVAHASLLLPSHPSHLSLTTIAQHLPAVPQTFENPTKQTSDSLPPFPQTQTWSTRCKQTTMTPRSHASERDPSLTFPGTDRCQTLMIANKPHTPSHCPLRMRPSFSSPTQGPNGRSRGTRVITKQTF